MPPNPEFEQPSRIPVISEKTRQELEDLLGVGEDDKTAQILTGISGERSKTTHERLSIMTENVFDQVLAFNRDFVAKISQVLEETHRLPGGQKETYTIDATTEGMAVILEAYQLESGHNLLSSLGNLEPEDLHIVQAIVKESVIGEGAEGVPLLERLLRAPKIPEHNANLNLSLNRITESTYPSYGRKQFKEGGVAMYRVLAHIWPKLGIPPVGSSNP